MTHPQEALLCEFSYQLCDLCQVMDVMLCNNIAHLYYPDRLFQSRVKRCSPDHRFVQCLRLPDQSGSLQPKFAQNAFDIPSIMIRLISLSVCKIRRLKCLSSSHKIFQPAHPQGFKIEQMAGIFLNGPLITFPMDENLFRQ